MTPAQIIEDFRTWLNSKTSSLSTVDYRQVLEDIEEELDARSDGLDADDAG